MTDIELNVPYLEKDSAKRLGARWDPIKRKWFIPTGLDPRPFSKWIIETEKELHTNSNENENSSLSFYLLKIATLVSENCSTPQWVRAEISHFPEPKRGNYYIELVENINDTTLAKAQAVIWRSNAESILNKFKKESGGELASGLKVLLLIVARFDPIYGLKLIIEDIDPSYTMGEMSAKLIKIREILISEKIYRRNYTLPIPIDFTNIAVISPSNAAGLGDVRRESDILEKYKLCKFYYLNAIFQGVEAPKDIISKIKKIQEIHLDKPFDALIIIRGGGAVSDLTWLNELSLARTICLCPVPVLVGIGHQKDSTILDEIASRKFDTPSKLSSYIFSTICNNAKNAQNNFLLIQQSADQNLKWSLSLIKSYLSLILQISNHFYIQRNQNLRHNFYYIANCMAHAVKQRELIIKSLINLPDLIQSKIQLTKNLVNNFHRQIIFEYINFSLERKVFEIQNLWKYILDYSSILIEQIKKEIESYMCLIIGLDPSAILARGFTLAKKVNGSTITSVIDAKNEIQFRIIFKDGSLSVKPNEEKIT